MRIAEPPSGWRVAKTFADGGTLFAPAGGENGASRCSQPSRRRDGVPHLDWSAEFERLRTAFSEDRKTELGSLLGVTAASLDAIGIGWATGNDLRRLRAGGAGWSDAPPDGAYVFAERDGSGRVAGLMLRAHDGRKGFAKGGKRGLIVPATLAGLPDPVLVTEGASDVAACCMLGLACVGRPSNAGGAEALAELLRGRAVLVLGENDQKQSGAWPGRDGAKRVATLLAGEWNEPVHWALPPSKIKDVREFVAAAVADGLDPTSTDACRTVGRSLLAELKKRSKEAKPSRLSQADRLARLARQHYRFGCMENDEPFAVPLEGRNVALQLRGRSSFRATLARLYARRTGKVPSGQALSDALLALEGDAIAAAREPVALRVALHDGDIVIDLGDETGRAIVVHPGTWEVADTSAVLFRRTALTAALPEPVRGGGVEELRKLLNVTDETWPLVLAWLIAAFMPEIPHPILLLSGIQGTGKTTAARFLTGLVDPSPAPLRSPPRDAEAWALAAAGSWSVVIDNVSAIPIWWSDALCKAVTGDGWVRRKLYTDGDLAVVAFRRVVTLTSIDAGALRGDLGDRLLLVDLEPITPENRRSETEVVARYEARRPVLFGALLDLLGDDRIVELGGEPSDRVRLVEAIPRTLAIRLLHSLRRPYNG